MYAELELIGVGAAVVADAWLRRPRRWHAPVLGGLVLCWAAHPRLDVPARGRAGRARGPPPRPRRVALAGGDRGGRSRLGAALGAVVPRAGAAVVTPTGSRPRPRPPAAHARLARRRSPRPAPRGAPRRRRWSLRPGAATATLLASSCAARSFPRGSRQSSGTVAPVLIDRTLTLVVWAPPWRSASSSPRSRRARDCSLLSRSLPSRWSCCPRRCGRSRRRLHPTPPSATSSTSWYRATSSRSAPPGSFPRSHGRSGCEAGLRSTSSACRASGMPRVSRIGTAPSTGRIWLLDWTRRPLPLSGAAPCAPRWSRATSRVLCLR